MTPAKSGILLYLWLGLLCCRLWSVDRHVFLDESDGPHLERIIGIDKGVFDRAHLREIGLDFAKQIDRNFNSGTLWVVTSRVDSEAVQGVRATDQTYEGWRHSWMQTSRVVFPVARVSVVRGSGIRLEMREASGQIMSDVLRHPDPLIITSDGRRIEIGYIVVREDRGIRAEGPLRGYKYTVLTYSPNATPLPLTIGFMKELSRRLRASDIQADLQMNTWFRHSNIPIVHPFQPPNIPPTSLAEAGRFSSWCSLLGSSVRCHSDP